MRVDKSQTLVGGGAVEVYYQMCPSKTDYQYKNLNHANQKKSLSPKLTHSNKQIHWGVSPGVRSALWTNRMAVTTGTGVGWHSRRHLRWHNNCLNYLF